MSFVTDPAGVWVNRDMHSGRRMLTIGSERAGVRITRGRLSRRAVWHDRQPCVFLLWRCQRVRLRRH